jgi:hypothetical protein
VLRKSVQLGGVSGLVVLYVTNYKALLIYIIYIARFNIVLVNFIL